MTNSIENSMGVGLGGLDSQGLAYSHSVRLQDYNGHLNLCYFPVMPSH
jgi:hypothetical protein